MLIEAISEMQQQDTPSSQLAVAELTHLANQLMPPRESHPQLVEMDKAIIRAIRCLIPLCPCAQTFEIQPILKYLRLILFSDRRRVEQGSKRQAIAAAIVLRKAWYIEHLAGLLMAKVKGPEYHRYYDRLPTDDPQRAEMGECLALMDEYVAAQKRYGQSLLNEISLLQSQLLQ